MPYGPAADRPAQRVTAADVRAVRFGKPPFGKRGYDEMEVDEFLRLVADTLALAPGGARVSAGQVNQVAFRKPRIGSRGYDEDEVDAFLDAVEAELRWRESPEGQHEVAAEASGGGIGPPGPMVGGPLGSGPMPMGSGPMAMGGGPMPMGSGPMGSGPMGSGPMGSGPMGGGPMGSGPMGAGPMGSGPMGSGPMGGGPVGMGGPSGPIGGLSAPRAVRAVAVAVIWDRGRVLATELTDSATGRTVYRPPGGDIAFGERGQDAVQRAFLEQFGGTLTEVRPLATLESIFRLSGQDGHELVLVYEAAPADPALWTQPRLVGRGATGPVTAVWVPIDLFRRGEATLLPDGMLALLETLPG